MKRGRELLGRWPLEQETWLVLTIGVALWVGVMAQTLGRSLKVPPILFYLLAGVALGPMGLDWIRPDTMGSGLQIFVEICVAIILFEAALDLPGAAFKPLPVSTRRLLGIAMPLTVALSAGLAFWLVGLGWVAALTFGSLIVVTGPTTIGPLLRNITVSRRLEVLLKQEATWGDCLGILLVSALLPLWQSADAVSVALVPYAILEKGALAAALGLGVGFFLSKALLPLVARLRDRQLPGMVAVSFAIVSFAAGQAISKGAGPIACAVAGFTLAATRSPRLREIKLFKGQLAYLFIAMLFVLLAALFDLNEIRAHRTAILLTALALGLVIRPLSAAVAFVGTDLTWPERVYIGLVGPRGIVALATAALLVVQYPTRSQAVTVFALAFTAIFLSGSFASLFGRPLAWLLGVRLQEVRTGVLFVGINDFSLALAQAVSGRVPVRLLDSNPEKVGRAAALGLEARCVDALEDAVYEEAAEEGFRRVLACTPNGALNALVLDRAEPLFGHQRVFRVPVSGGPAASVSGAPDRRTVFGWAFDLPHLLAAPGEWGIAQRDEIREWDVPLASLAKGGVRLLRAGEKGASPWLVLSHPAGEAESLPGRS